MLVIFELGFCLVEHTGRNFPIFNLTICSFNNKNKLSIQFLVS